MIGVDANILLRLLLNDDVVQVEQVRARLARAIAAREDVYVGPVALAETVWTLLHRRQVPKAEIGASIAALGQTPPFRLFDDKVVAEAMTILANARAGFSDCLIRSMDAAAGCRATLTFDRAAQTLPGFVHPTDGI